MVVGIVCRCVSSGSTRAGVERLRDGEKKLLTADSRMDKDGYGRCRNAPMHGCGKPRKPDTGAVVGISRRDLPTG